MNTDALIELLGDPDSSLAGLSALLQARREAVSRRHTEGEEPDPLAATFVHPLLLCTSIAQAVLGDESGSATVESYALGEPVPGLEDRLLVLADDAGADLALLLDIESALLDDLMVLSMELAGFRPGLSTDVLLGIVVDLVERTFSAELELSIHNVRWAAWLLTNPELTFAALQSEAQSAQLFIYGFAHNSRFHNATTHEEESLIAARAAFNDGLARGSDTGALEALKARHDLALRRVERARQFYWWNPCEIDAHAVSDSVGREFDRQAQSEGADS